MWVGYRSSNKPLENIEGFGAVYGGTIPAAIWKDFMTTATKRLAPKDWPEPKHPMVYKPFDATTTFGYNPRATPPTPPATPGKPKKPANQVPVSPPTQVVIAPQG